MNQYSTTVKKNEKVDRNLFIYDFYTNYPHRKEDALEILADKFEITRRRVQFVVAQMRNKTARAK